MKRMNVEMRNIPLEQRSGIGISHKCTQNTIIENSVDITDISRYI